MVVNSHTTNVRHLPMCLLHVVLQSYLCEAVRPLLRHVAALEPYMAQAEAREVGHACRLLLGLMLHR